MLPKHHVSLELHMAGDKPLQMQVIQFGPPYWVLSGGSRIDSHTITATSGETIIDGPGKVIVQGSFQEPELPLAGEPREAKVRLRVVAPALRSAPTACCRTW